MNGVKSKFFLTGFVTVCKYLARGPGRGPDRGKRTGQAHGARGKGAMGSSRLDRLFADLSATFEAAEEREEASAAADLAFSLDQDRTLPGTLARVGGTLELPGGGKACISEVGADYVGADLPTAVLVPIAHLVIRLDGGLSPPQITVLTFIERLRLWARRGASVQVDTPAGRLGGRLQRVTADHLAIRSQEGATVVGWSAVKAIRLRRGTRVDVP